MGQSSLFFLGLWVLAGSPLAGRADDGRIFYGEHDGVRVLSALPREIHLLESILGGSANGEGGGGNVASVCEEGACSLQCTYDDPAKGNEVLLVWQETALHADGVSVRLDGAEVCKVQGLPESRLPGLNFCIVSSLQPTCKPQEGDPSCPSNLDDTCKVSPTSAAGQFGAHVYKFEIRGAEGTIGRTCQDVITSLPMANELDLCLHSNAQAEVCSRPGISSAAIRDQHGCDPLADDADCCIIVTGGHAGPPPTFLEIQLDGNPAARLNGNDSFCFEQDVPVVFKGSHAIALFGYLGRDDASDRFWSDPTGQINFNGLVGAFLLPPLELNYDTACGAAPPPSKSFLPSNCNGDDTVDISDAIVGLTHLFIGGADLPCLAACESNGEGEFDISDSIYLLFFLFLSGPSPAGWADPNRDGVPDCLEAAAGADCKSSHARCQ